MSNTLLLKRFAALLAIALSSACDGGALIPELGEFSPTQGTPGTRVELFGLYFDRDGQGYPMQAGNRSWQVFLIGPERRYALEIVDATDHSLSVLIPNDAVSGPLALVGGEGTISQTVERFDVIAHPVIRLINDAQYDVFDLRLNGEQVLTDGRVLESGANLDVQVTAARYKVEYSVGELRVPWVRGAIHGLDVSTPGVVALARIPELDTLAMLSPGGLPTDWVAELRDTLNQKLVYSIRIYSDGDCAFYAGSAPAQTGKIIASKTAPYATQTPFRLMEGGQVAKFGPPFTSFDLANGPPHWPLLQYVRVMQ